MKSIPLDGELPPARREEGGGREEADWADGSGSTEEALRRMFIPLSSWLERVVVRPVIPSVVVVSPGNLYMLALTNV